MKKTYILSLSWTITLLFILPGLLSASTPKINFSSEGDVNIKADMMYYDQIANLYFAEGNVVILRENSVLKANKVTYNIVSQDAKAVGNVTLTEGEDILRCERLDINMDTRVGTISQATLFIKENNYHISGQSFEKLGENRYRVLHGTVTTCDGDAPDWKITGGEIDVTLEGIATLKNSTFQIRNVPIVYFPYFLYPLKTKRSTGFLLPDFHYSSSDGVEINNSFFWAISGNTDATFYLDYSEEKGLGGGMEFRYVLNKRSKGKVFQYYTEERSSYFEDEYNPTYGRNRKRGLVDYEGEHYFNDTSYAKAHMIWLSDRKIYKDYGTEIRRSKSEWDMVHIRSKEKSESFIFYTKNWSQYSLTSELNYFKDLLERDRTTLQRLPKITFSGQRQNLTGTPLYFKVDSSYDYFSRHHGVEGQRIDLFPKISWPSNFNNYVKFTPEIGIKSVFAYDLTKNRKYDKTKSLLDANAELSTTVLRVYTISGKKIAKLKHSIEPKILYRYVSDEDQDEFPFYGPMDRNLSGFYNRNGITYSLTNRLTAKVLQPDGSFAEQEFAFLRISQSYYFTHPEGAPILEGYNGNDSSDLRTKLRRKNYYFTHPDEEMRFFSLWPPILEGYNGNDFSDLLTELRLSFTEYAYFKGHVSYNPYHNNLSWYNTYLFLKNKRDDYIRFEYRYVRDELEGYYIKTRLKLSNKLSAFYKGYHSEFNSSTLDSLYGLEYYAQCWSIRFSFQERAKQDGRDRESEYSILFNLAGLGKLGEFEGDMD